MRRIIEELVEKRKKQQAKVEATLLHLANQFPDSGLFFNRRKNKAIKDSLLDFNRELNQLMTVQDKEWDAYSNNHSSTIFKSLQWKIGKLEAEYSNIKTLLINFTALEKSLEKLINSLNQDSQDLQDDQDEKTANASAKAETVQRLKEIKEQLSPYQYSDFEQRFRGGEADVKEKLKRYLPCFANTDHILDIGCGRGEFLQLLQEEGKRAEGIDISLSMLQAAQEKGLDCRKTDALENLREREDQSLGGIFSAQVIEHLQPDYLRDLVLEAFRVLKPGTPIVLETVNPLSLFALSNIYFLDVTHQKPLHPEYMRYLLESTGFGGVDILYSEEEIPERLMEIGPDQPNARAFNTNVDKLNKLLYASPVYAVTGTKP